MNTVPTPAVSLRAEELEALAAEIKAIGAHLGFQQVGIADTDLQAAQASLDAWLQQGRHGEMDYMARHGTKRSHPEALLPGAVRVISARMDYFPESPSATQETLDDANRAYVARYALGRDYHKVLRGRLKRLGRAIGERVGEYGYRVCVDSAPVLEKAIAEKAGLGWIGKHTNLINDKAGSWFLLGEILTDLPLPIDEPATEHCGTCRACLDACPTGAIVAPFELDATLCISYLTIELRGAIPVELRSAIGNRIFGCDDCQIVCPWNKFAQRTQEDDFTPRHALDTAELVHLFDWDERQWSTRTEGSALRRVGYEGWLRNIAVALGNAPSTSEVISALRRRAEHPSALVREHVAWALAQHGN
ncbi:MAG: tRNA epoxyqueuosine(34) reductase QueG [Gammaproteobacteria bacterium]|nr:tRNA epoxyqueuosine(34) reductase QueG [Gammaproteobacteria bacterium]